MDFILNYDYKKAFNDVQNELNNEKKKNQELEKELKQLKNELQLERNKNMTLTKANEELKNKIKSLELYLKKKDDELEKLAQKLLNLNNKKSKNIDENFIAIAFTTDEKNFIFPVSCQITEKFVNVETKLYDEYPQYQDELNYFTVDGHKITKFKTLSENGIKYSNVIILHKKK